MGLRGFLGWELKGEDPCLFGNKKTDVKAEIKGRSIYSTTLLISVLLKTTFT